MPKNHFATMQEDTVIIPELVIETVAGEIVHDQTKDLTDEVRKKYLLGRRDDLEKFLLEYLERVYNSNGEWRKKIAKKDGIGVLRVFLLHWAGVWTDAHGKQDVVPFDKTIDSFYERNKKWQEEQKRKKK